MAVIVIALILALGSSAFADDDMNRMADQMGDAAQLGEDALPVIDEGLAANDEQAKHLAKIDQNSKELIEETKDFRTRGIFEQLSRFFQEASLFMKAVIVLLLGGGAGGVIWGVARRIKGAAAAAASAATEAEPADNRGGFPQESNTGGQQLREGDGGTRSRRSDRGGNPPVSNNGHSSNGNGKRPTGRHATVTLTAEDRAAAFSSTDLDRPGGHN